MFQKCPGISSMYRDHLGRRVLADVEGNGYYEIQAKCSAEIEVNETLTSELQGTFDKTLLAASREPGDIQIQWYDGRSEPPSGAVTSALLPYQGSGWVVSAQQPFEVDDLKRPSHEPSKKFPVPFFRKLSGTGKVEIIKADTSCKLIDCFQIEDEDALKAREFKVQNISKVSTLKSCFANGEGLERPIASHLNACSWRCPITPDASGLIIRKLYDCFHGRQRARVFIDGTLAGWWYEPYQNRETRWRISDFGISEKLLQGKSSVEITIDPPSGTPLWSVSQIEIYELHG